MREGAGVGRVTVVALAALASTTCVLPTYTWVPEGAQANDDAGADAARASDGAALGALRGSVTYPTGPGGRGVSTAALRVWVDPNDPDAGGCDASRAWPPAYQQDIDPAPVPASYYFGGVPPGEYCVRLVLDWPPRFAPGEPPGCEDSRTPAIPVTVVAPLTTLPTIVMPPPPGCP